MPRLIHGGSDAGSRRGDVNGAEVIGGDGLFDGGDGGVGEIGSDDSE